MIQLVTIFQIQEQFMPVMVKIVQFLPPTQIAQEILQINLEVKFIV